MCLHPRSRAAVTAPARCRAAAVVLRDTEAVDARRAVLSPDSTSSSLSPSTSPSSLQVLGVACILALVGVGVTSVRVALPLSCESAHRLIKAPTHGVCLDSMQWCGAWRGTLGRRCMTVLSSVAVSCRAARSACCRSRHMACSGAGRLSCVCVLRLTGPARGSVSLVAKTDLT